jgi:hypothetical protein
VLGLLGVRVVLRLVNYWQLNPCGGLHTQAPPLQLMNEPWCVQSSQALPHTPFVSPLHAPPPQSLKPLLQSMPHEVPLQVAVPCGSVGQALQLEPHDPVLVSDRQLPPQLWKPVRQPVSEHVPAVVSHAPVPFGYSVVQLVRLAPQTVLLFASQPPLNA